MRFGTLKYGVVKLTKELLRNAIHPVTVNYPAKKDSLSALTEISDESRGKHRFDEVKCVGCGACTVVCSSSAITESDSDLERTLSVEIGRCIFCGRCRDICPEKGLELTPEFEISKKGQNANDCIKVEHSVPLGPCDKCGRPTFPIRQIESVKKRVSEKIDPANLVIVNKDMEIFMRYCPDCRRTASYALRTHPRKSY